MSTEKYVAVACEIAIGGPAMTVVVDMPESVAADEDKRFDWIMGSIEVNWDE